MTDFLRVWVWIIALILATSTLIQCGGDEADPPSTTPGTGAPPAPPAPPGPPGPPAPPAGVVGGPIDAASPGTSWDKLPNRNEVTKILLKNLKAVGSATVNNDQSLTYTLNSNQAGTTLTLTNTKANTPTTRPFLLAGGISRQGYFILSIDIPTQSGYRSSSYEFVSSYRNWGLSLYSTDQIALFSGSGPSGEELLKIAFQLANPPMQRFIIGIGDPYSSTRSTWGSGYYPTGYIYYPQTLKVRQQNFSTNFQYPNTQPAPQSPPPPAGGGPYPTQPPPSNPSDPGTDPWDSNPFGKQ